MEPLEPLTGVAPPPQAAAPEPGWPDESWREYIDHCLTRDDVDRPRRVRHWLPFHRWYQPPRNRDEVARHLAKLERHTAAARARSR